MKATQLMWRSNSRRNLAGLWSQLRLRVVRCDRLALPPNLRASLSSRRLNRHLPPKLSLKQRQSSKNSLHLLGKRKNRRIRKRRLCLQHLNGWARLKKLYQNRARPRKLIQNLCQQKKQLSYLPLLLRKMTQIWKIRSQNKRIKKSLQSIQAAVRSQQMKKMKRQSLNLQ